MKPSSVRSRLLLPVFLVTLGLLTCFGALLFWKFRNARPASTIRQLRINEICTVNPGTAIGEATTYEDYIELYNPTDETISLGELCLSDNPRRCDLAPLPDKTIEPTASSASTPSARRAVLRSDSFLFPSLSRKESLSPWPGSI